MARRGSGVMHAAAYVRVSSRSQDLGSQRTALERAAAARGDEIRDWYIEKQSARTLARPVLDAVRELVRRGHIRKLFVFRLDRLTRSGIRDTLSLVEELRGAGCELVPIADGFELGGPAGDVVLAVIAWAAQMERLALGERISAARARVEASGRAWGRPRRATAEQCRRVLELRRQMVITKSGRTRPCTIREIAERVNLPRTTVSEILSGKGAFAARSGAAEKTPRETATLPSSG